MNEKIHKICFLFPGQGSQKIGMGKEISKLFKSCKEVFECASEIFGFSVLNLCENDEKSLKKTEFAQIAICATSISAFSAIKEKGIKADFLVGHSLGQYCSLYVANILSLEDTFKLLKIRIDSIKDFAPKKNTSMCAIIGVDSKTIEEECKKANSYVACANFNSANQTVISGETEGVLEVSKKLEKTAKRCILLNVSSAFHCNLMKDAALSFAEKIKDINFKNPTIPIYSNVTANKIKTGNEIKSLLVEHFTSPVLFTKILENLEKENVSLFVELGQGKTLSSLTKKTLKNAITLNIEDKSSFLKTIDSLENIFKISAK